MRGRSKSKSPGLSNVSNESKVLSRGVGGVESVFVLNESESERDDDDEGDRYEEGFPSFAISDSDDDAEESSDADRRSDVSRNADIEGNPDHESDELKLEG